MNKHNIQQLLDRFYEGQTSEEEEDRLRTYFRSENAPSEWAEEQKFWNEMQIPNIPVPEGMEKRIEAKINSLANTGKKATNMQRHSMRLWISSIAVGLLLCVAGYHFYSIQKQTGSQEPDTFSNPQEAYAETQKALILFSSKLNEGLNKMENLPTNNDL